MCIYIYIIYSLSAVVLDVQSDVYIKLNKIHLHNLPQDSKKDRNTEER